MLLFSPHCLHVTIKYNPVFFPQQFLPKPSTSPPTDNRKSSTKISRCRTQNWTAQSRCQSQTREKQCPIATSGTCVHSILCATRLVVQSLMKIISAKAHESCPHTTKATQHPQLSNAHP